MRVAFYTLGCKVNQYETNAMAEEFSRHGFDVVPAEQEAEVYVLNSCTVTAGSDKKTRQLVRRFKRQNPQSVVALLGCFPQAFPEAAKALPEADVLLGASNKKALLAAVQSRLEGGERVIQIESYQKEAAFERVQVSDFGSRTRAFVKIQDGCQRFCAYCIIPKARGPVRSKPLEDLKEEVLSLAAAGYQEVVLVGINLSCYGQDFGKHLLDAVKVVAEVDGIQRIRLGSLEPELLGSKEIQELAAVGKLCPQFHLSLQSGSDRTLERMKRHYTTEDYREIVRNLRAAFENTAITTDIMVGFPGETEEEFQESMTFLQEMNIARAHVFAYSRRPGTLADTMEDQISSSVKAERSHQMQQAADETQQEFLRTQQGRTEEVLFETQGLEGWEGYTPNYTQVVVPSNQDLAGKILKVKLLEVLEGYCLGELLE